MQTNTTSRDVVLVDQNDNQIGLENILIAHRRPGILHRAISVILWRLNDAGEKEFLLQHRSELKPLWPLYWSNTCCTHPFETESYLDCAVRRLREELGIVIDPSQLSIKFPYQYQADYNEELSEHELTTVIVGQFNPGMNHPGIEPNPQEVNKTKWLAWSDLQQDIQLMPSKFTPWSKIIFQDERFLKEVHKQ